MAAEVVKKAPPAEGKASAGTPLLTATLHKTHLISVIGGDALSVSVENTETGDKFFTVVPLVLVPDHPHADANLTQSLL